MASKTLLLAALALPVASHAQVTVVSDNFTTAGTTNWFMNTASTSNTLGVNEGRLELNQNVSGNFSTQLITHFTTSNSALTLSKVGDYVQVSFTMAYSAVNFDQNNILRVGVYNSNGAQLTSGSNASSNSQFTSGTGYQGYSLFTNPSTSNTATNLGLYERTTNTSTTLVASADNTRIHALNGNDGFAATTTTFNVSLRFERVSTGLSITTTAGYPSPSTNSVSITVVDETPSTYAFDTLGIWIPYQSFSGTNRVGTVAFDDYSVTTNVSNIPEPSSAAALVGVFALGAVALRRRRK